jgi:hypothetical protein
VIDPASLWRDFLALCDCGGRFAGTPGEAQAIAYLAEAGAAATGQPAIRTPLSYAGWRATSASLTHGGETLRCHPLVRSAPGGLTAELVDVGSGTAAEFAARAAEIPGRIVLVRYEYAFAATNLHRRLKYQAAVAHGAVGFLIAAFTPGEALVGGSSGRGAEAGIPCLGISLESAARLAAGGAVTIELQTEEFPAVSETLCFDLPGQTDELVVLSAHLDGHDLAESAIDNASGCAAALAVARSLAPVAAGFRRGLRLCFFSVEEWALTGSRLYLAGLPEAERARMVLNVNLDSVAGSAKLTALTSGFANLHDFLQAAAAACGQTIGLHAPLMENSDHANFAAAGIPAIRLLAGFDDPASELRHVLTDRDTRDKVDLHHLLSAATLAASIIQTACTANLLPQRSVPISS